MDLGNIIIGAILIASFVVLFVFIGRNKKKREAKALQPLINIANRLDCNVSKHEICGNFVIGIDESKNIVFFYKNIKDKAFEAYVNLVEIQNARVRKRARTIEYRNGNNAVIDQIELLFVPSDKKKKEIAWEFFNTDISMQLRGELQTAELWSELINDQLKIKK